MRLALLEHATNLNRIVKAKPCLATLRSKTLHLDVALHSSQTEDIRIETVDVNFLDIDSLETRRIRDNELLLQSDSARQLRHCDSGSSYELETPAGSEGRLFCTRS